MLEILIGDVMAKLAEIPDNSVQCVVTSPPYWGLRDYGTAAWDGGDSSCDHKYTVSSPYNAGFNERWGNAVGAKKQESERHEVSYKDICPKCGATRIDSQIGLEKTPEEYVAKLVLVFREVRRVLRKDGTCWVNLGDSYYNYRPGNYSDNRPHSFGGSRTDDKKRGMPDNPDSCKRGQVVPGLKEKDLCGIPWRIAFALQADGCADLKAVQTIDRIRAELLAEYDDVIPDKVLNVLSKLDEEYRQAKGSSWWLRSDIIWAKPNPMPESVTDRPTKSHEYIFLLTKSANYYFDQDAVREPALSLDPEHISYRPNSVAISQNGRKEFSAKHEMSARTYDPAGRNIRTVWNMATQPYSEAHFATFPEELPKRCILAGTSARGCCPDCGAPWERVTERGEVTSTGGNKKRGMSDVGNQRDLTLSAYSTVTTGWQPTCACGIEETTPCTVLDHFGGSGTVGKVALELGRRAILIELNPEYVEMIRQRCAVTMGFQF